jgi:subtilase family serine protease
MRLCKTAAIAAVAAVCLAPLAAPRASALEKAALGARVSAAQTVQFDVYLPLRNQPALDSLLSELQNPQSPLYHKWLRPAEFNARFGPDPASIAAVRLEIEAYGLTVTPRSSHVLRVTGSARAAEQLLATELHSAAFPSGRQIIAASRPLSLSPAMASAHAVVSGFSPTIHMRTMSFRAAPQTRYAPVGPYWFDDLKQAYSFPSYRAFSGSGVRIGVLMAGGYQQSDMNAYFSHEKLKSPHFSEVKVEGGAPFDPNSNGSLEAELDLQQTGGMAPGADITLYSIPDLSDASIMAGLTTIDEHDSDDVVTMSFGGPEKLYAPEYNSGQDYTGILRAEDDLFKQGNAEGITFVASSGDSGAKSVPPPACFSPSATPSCGWFTYSAQFPASSPHVTAVGGTNLVTNHSPGRLDSGYVREAAYGDNLSSDIFYYTPARGAYFGSGGGDSILFPRPSYQNAFATGSTYRTVPDLALHMGGCPSAATSCEPNRSADLEIFGGSLYEVVGTSASAPDFAGLVALKVQHQGKRLGNVNYDIYSMAAREEHGGPVVFHRGIPGDNGYVATGPYNRVIGVGTVYGKYFLQDPAVPAAGFPQSPTNP